MLKSGSGCWRFRGNRAMFEQRFGTTIRRLLWNNGPKISVKQRAKDSCVYTLHYRLLKKVFSGNVSASRRTVKDLDKYD